MPSAHVGGPSFAPDKASSMNRLHALLLLLVTLALMQVASAAAAPAEPSPRFCTTVHVDEEVCIERDSYVRDVCIAISRLAARWDLPKGFFARLIWQESRFDASAFSPAGAQGIAQFMPGRAQMRGLTDPFDPAAALASSAEYLSALGTRFGNLGLAAAAYNGGENRLDRYVSNGGGPLPLETRAYVNLITGHPVDQWLLAAPEVDYALAKDIDFHSACLDMAEATAIPMLVARPAHWQPWGALILQSASPEVARAGFERDRHRFASVLQSEELMLITVRNPRFGNGRRYSAMVGRQTRAEAQALCQRLVAAGGRCVVQKNYP
jgi:hypothetical protein